MNSKQGFWVEKEKERKKAKYTVNAKFRKIIANLVLAMLYF